MSIRTRRVGVAGAGSGVISTFIARHGDEGPDYTSGPGPFGEELAEAMRRHRLMR